MKAKEKRIKELEAEHQKATQIIEENIATRYRIEGALAILKEGDKDVDKSLDPTD